MNKEIMLVLLATAVFVGYTIQAENPEVLTAAYQDYDGRDPYELAECVKQEQPVNVKFYDSNSSLVRYYREIGNRKGPDPVAFATYNSRTEIHTLHTRMVTSLKDGDLKNLGHELLHALCGNWHGSERG